MTTFLSTTQIDTLLENEYDTIAPFDEDWRYQCYNFLNQFLYPSFVAVNPNDYLVSRTIKTIANTAEYALPTSTNIYQDNQAGGLYETYSGTTYYALNYDAESSGFTVGETLTGGTSGATGTIAEVVDNGTTGTLRLTGVSGTFQDDETITDSATGSATANGTAVGFEYSERKYGKGETGFGSQDDGYWLNPDDQIVITPTPSSSMVLIFRYIPELSEVSNSSTTTIIPIRFKEQVLAAMQYMADKYLKDGNMLFLHNQETQMAIKSIFKNIRKTPAVMKLKKTSTIYQRGRPRVYSESE